MPKHIKRENGEGSVYRRKDLKRRPWTAVAPAEYIVDLESGKTSAKRIVIGQFATMQEAKAALDAYIKTPSSDFNITWSELYSRWSAMWFRRIGDKMIKDYENAWKHLSTLHEEKVRTTGTEEMQAIIDRLAAGRNADGTARRPLGRSALSKIKILLGLLGKEAQKRNIVMQNYADFILLPKAEKKPIECFSAMEVEKIRRAIGVVPYADWIYFLCLTGYRAEEFLSITPTQIVTTTDGVLAIVGGAKTEAGKNRVVPLVPAAEEILQKQLALKGQTVFCKPDGSKMRYEFFTRSCYTPALEQIGVRPLTTRATRRRFSTALSAAGVSEQDILKLMGHTDIGVDRDHYIAQEAKTLLTAIGKIV